MGEVHMSARPRLIAHARLQWDSVRSKQVLLAPERVLVLNEAAAAVLARCDGRRSVSDIAALLTAQYRRDVAEEVCTLMNRLAGKGLIEVAGHD